jgi:hypothetical protein
MDLQGLVPLVSVLLGAAITYVLNVRSRRRADVDEVFHDAIAAVAVAMASPHYIGQIGWAGSTPEEEADLAASTGREATERYIRAVADARAAVARASAYDESLTEFYRADSATFAARGDELMSRLRQHFG